MSSMLRKGMSWLGLGPDEDYEEYDFIDDQFDYEDAEPPAPSGAASRPAPRPVARPQIVTEDWDEAEPGGIRVLPSNGPTSSPSEGPRARGVVRPLPTASAARPQVVSPRSFNDAQEVGDLFKRRQPVVLNLQGLDRDLARRLLDFASGVAYGLGGTVERAASHVYLVTPIDVEISAEDRRRIQDGVLAE
ncbi:MAG: cell division protein SepF [Microthrixaceae bacterium]|nr:cell division protein SepF [Microthrixaceae bacterium]